MKPSPSELPLLKCLWAERELSARELHDRVAEELGWSPSSTRKTLERMLAKGLVAQRDLHGVRVYRAKAEKLPTLASLTRDFARRVLGMETPPPVSAFTGSTMLSEEELAELETLLAKDTDE